MSEHAQQGSAGEFVANKKSFSYAPGQKKVAGRTKDAAERKVDRTDVEIDVPAVATQSTARGAINRFFVP
jgi:hypothetical protein